MIKPPDSVHWSNNAAVIAQLADFYIKDGQRVADVTYGRGAFWRQTDTSRFDFRPTDLIPNLDIDPPHAKQADFRRLPYSDSSMHLVVFDPPFVAHPPRPCMNRITKLESYYRCFETTRGMNYKDIINLYQRGMCESQRVLRPNGMLWVKCRDIRESQHQCWSHIDIKQAAEQLGFFAKDLYIVVSKSRTYYQRQAKHHACKIHSYFWVFVKMD